MSKTVYILNGPNLDMLGERDPQLYGTDRLTSIEERCAKRVMDRGWTITFHQSNHEGLLIDWIHEAHSRADALIINAGAFGHTSIALRDALEILRIPIIEVHLSNVHARESFRHFSYVTPVATGMICGLGARGYELALDFLEG